MTLGVSWELMAHPHTTAQTQLPPGSLKTHTPAGHQPAPGSLRRVPRPQQELVVGSGLHTQEALGGSCESRPTSLTSDFCPNLAQDRLGWGWWSLSAYAFLSHLPRETWKEQLWGPHSPH